MKIQSQDTSILSLKEEDIYNNDSPDKRYLISAYFERFKASNFMSKQSKINHQNYKQDETGNNNLLTGAKKSRS